MSVKSASLICLLALVQSTVSARADDIAPKKSREMRVAHATLPVRHSLQLPSPKAFMRIYGQAEAPYGYLRFCSRNAEECRPAGAELERVEATPARLSALDAINRTVNRTIEPATDKELYGEVQGRLRGLCPPEAKDADRPGLANQRAATDRRAG